MHIQLNKNGIAHLQSALIAALNDGSGVATVPEEMFKTYEKKVLQSLIKPTSDSFNGTIGFATSLLLDHPTDRNKSFLINLMTNDFEIVE